MVQKAHHLAGGVVNIDGAFQYEEIGVQDRFFQRRQVFIVRAVGQIRFETAVAAAAGVVKVPGQKKLLHLAAHLFRQLSGHHAGAPLMVLAVNNGDLHRLSPPFQQGDARAGQGQCPE